MRPVMVPASSVRIAPLRQRRRLLPLVAAMAVALAACGSSVTPTSVPSASAAAVSPSATPNLHAAPDLEALLPDTIAGKPVSKVSMGGADFIALGPQQGQAQLQTLLQQLGRSVSDLSVADTYDPTGAVVDQAAIFRVKGADPTRLLSLWVASQKVATSGSTTVTTATIGGRTYTRLEDRSQSRPAISYVLSSGDSLYIVATSDEQVVLDSMRTMLPG